MVNQFTQCPPGSQCFELSASGGDFGDRAELFGCMESPKTCETFTSIGLALGASTIHECQILPEATDIQGFQFLLIKINLSNFEKRVQFVWIDAL